LARDRFVWSHTAERMAHGRVEALMRARRLRSSMIDRILFDDEAETLSIWFKASGKYDFLGVPRAIYDALGHAKSAGTFFNEAIKGRFACRPASGRRSYPLGEEC
jgi:hypothetical protein